MYRKGNMENKTINAMTVTLKGLTVLPREIIHFDMGRTKSIHAVEKAMEGDECIFLITQRNPEVTDPDADGLYQHGTMVKIRQVVKLQNGNLRLMVEGMYKARLLEIIDKEDFYVTRIEAVTERGIPFSEEKEAMLRIIKSEIKDYAQNNQRFAKEALPRILDSQNLEEILFLSASSVDFDYHIDQEILDAEDEERRYEILARELIKENAVVKIKNEFQKQLNSNINQNQKEYVMREQLKIIQKELGESSPLGDTAEYEKKLEAAKIAPEYKQRLKKEISRLSAMGMMGQESNVIRTYLDTIFDMPFEVYTTDNQDIKRAAKVLNGDHYGLEKVKDRIIEYLAVKILNPQGNSPILCLVGPPGTGKTSVARSVASAMNRKYIRISLGGVKDEAEIRGHRRTYVGAMPGRIAEGLRNAKVANPLMLLDEIDKSSGDYKGDLSSALLEVLDSEQNNKFSDHYIEIPLDLSKVLFIATANTLDTIPRPLLDRMDVIEINSYTENEKFHIAKSYLVKKQMDANGLKPEDISFGDRALKKIIHNYTREAGVRNLERRIGDICRKCARKKLEGAKSQIRVTEKLVKELLGKERVNFEPANERDEVGIVRGLAWTSVGGDTLQIEVNMMPGKGGLTLTGNMGDVMKESARIALSCVRSIVPRYHVASDFFENNDFHLHIPEGAVPKDGPSAGITMATAMLSAITGKKVRADVAMTGEITLRGRVLPIGGLKEKLLAARMAGIKEALVPGKNRPDVEELSSEILGDLKITYVDSMEEVLLAALSKEEQ